MKQNFSLVLGDSERTLGSITESEIASQPEMWERVTRDAAVLARPLPGLGERVAVVGCGTSWFVAQAYAGLREQLGGETDAFTPADLPASRNYDRLIAITRSGTTTEIMELLERVRGTIPTVAVVGASAGALPANEVIDLSFADERSVVQTRFATTAFALLRSSIGIGLGSAVEEARSVLEAEVGPLLGFRQYTFLGLGWTVGLAHEAALKLREAAQLWSDSYPALEYRHGPIALADPSTVVIPFGPMPPGLAKQILSTGARLVSSDLDPMAVLVLAHRIALASARGKGLDADRPRNLSRSVVLAANGC